MLELCREHGMSSTTLCKWRAKYGGMDDVIHDGSLKEPEEEKPVTWRDINPKQKLAFAV